MYTKLQIITIYTTDCQRTATKQSKGTHEHRVGHNDVFTGTNNRLPTATCVTMNDTLDILHPSVT